MTEQTEVRVATVPPRVARLLDAIVSVSGGRGFLVEQRYRLTSSFLGEEGSFMVRNRYVLTAGHCLPFLPPPHPASYTQERTYVDLIGQLGATNTVTVECRYVDPISDTAVLCEPDNQVMSDEWDAWCDLVDGRLSIPVGRFADACEGWVFGLDNEWHQCQLKRLGRSSWLSITGASFDATAPGTSGSPVFTADGRAVALISCGGGERQPNPILSDCLPRWWKL